MKKIPSNNDFLILKQGREYQIARGHPWIFSGAIQHKPQITAGQIVGLKSSTNEPIGFGFYEDRSIAVKVISGATAWPDEVFWRSRFIRAIKFREQLGLPCSSTNAYRLINAEADCIPGLVIDIFNHVAVIEFQGAGPRLLKELWLQLLKELLPNLSQVVIREDIESQSIKSTERIQITENGLKLWVALSGQKTGYFLDQAQNRELVRKFSKGKKILDCFCYSGGFTLAAIAGDCESVLSLDSSAAALELVRDNIALNFEGSNDKFNQEQVDCLDWLHKTQERFDLIILDPPAFVKTKAAVRGGISGYQTINRLAFEMLEPGGFLFTFSCSQLIGKLEFEEVVREAAARAGRNIKVVSHLEQAISHAYSLAHPEGSYLKGLLLVATH